ncbi:MAG: gliding motility-associated ABC transporter substrate-binding protein GldG [Bacteroidetes bacterium]|nr:gliding motility-associated ABC transporter substrate-binding protein GldG [Bacteroidota bacterium]
MFTLLKKEINSFLNALIGYIVIIVFLVFMGLFLWLLPMQFNILDFGYANLDGLFIFAPFVFLFLIPAITMRSFAEEKRSGTLELLLTQPLTDNQIILAKWLSGVVLVAFALLPTLIYFLSVYLLGDPAGNMDTGATWGSYMGLFLLGAVFVAIGIFASSISDNQIVAFITAAFLSAFLYIGFELFSDFTLSGTVALFVQSLGINAHYASMSRGVIDSRDLVYFFSVILLFILLTKVSMESRKWKTMKLRVTDFELRVNTRKNSFLLLGIGLTFIILVNIISTFVFYRLDLTAEKKYSLSPYTRDMLKNLDDIVYFKVYLHGDFPSGFKRLEKETRELLDEFRSYNKDIEYEFIDPSESPGTEERNSVYELLMEKGLVPTSLRVNEKGQSKQQVIFPGTIVTYKGRDLPVQLLQSQLGIPPQEVLNNSVQNLEYNLTSAIRRLTAAKKDKIAFLEGQGELGRMETVDIEVALSEYYITERVAINGKINSLAERRKYDTTGKRLFNKFKAIIIAKPTRTFDEKDKFLLDQYIMRGGKVLWLIDPVFASMDSLQTNNETFGVYLDVNLDDMLFRYGSRINHQMVMDLNALPIPVKTGQMGNKPNFEFFPWYYFPLVTPASAHPIVRNLNAVKTEFPGNIDSVDVPGIRRTKLLVSSKYARTVNTPAVISLNILKQEPDERLFNNPYQVIAILMEGQFSSLYENRIPPAIAEDTGIGFKALSNPTTMIVVADGDVIRNQFQAVSGTPLPLGYDQYTGQTFGNKEFILNCVNHLCDDEGFMTVRTREVKLRLLDMQRVEKQKLFWQLINILVPVILIILFGFAKTFIRKNKYARIS